MEKTISSTTNDQPPAKKWSVCLVFLFAICYYASYYRYGLNLGGEGGTAGVIALRLLEGQRPIADTFLGYNVLWFYPIAWLFRITGPNYLAIKIYFFAICTITALLGTLLVRRATGSSLLAAGTGVLLVLIPGMQFRNYMPFLGVMNMFTLLQAFVFSHNRSWKQTAWMVVAGLALGVTYLIRIDVGIFISTLIVALIIVLPWSVENGLLRGFTVWAKGVILIFLFAAALHLPVLWDAHRRGFQNQFLGQYAGWVAELRYRTTNLFQKTFPGLLPPAVDQQAASQASSPHGTLPPPTVATAGKPKLRSGEENTTLRRPPISDMIYGRRSIFRSFALAIYLPIPIAVLILVGVGIRWISSAVSRNFEECRRSLGVLVALGCALTLFPQYFFFRPDTPHLSEFMVPFLVAMVLACLEAGRIAFVKKGIWAWVYAVILLGFCIPDVIAHVHNGLRRESSGSIAVRNTDAVPFNASNGVHVLVRARELPMLEGIYSTILAHSSPNDWVVCYPYSPTINFMTNRRSYEVNLYVDNVTQGKNFHASTVKNFEHYRPAIVIVDNRAINKSEFSRFKNWAEPTYEYIQNHYRLDGVYGLNEVYVLRSGANN